MELPALEPLEVFRIGPGLVAPQPEHATATPPPSPDKSGSLESLVPGIGNCGKDSAGISPRILKRKLADLAIPTDSSPKSAKCAKTQIETDRSTDVNGNGDGSDAQHGVKSQLGDGTRLVVGTELRGESQHCAEESNDSSGDSGWGTEANPGPERLAVRLATLAGDGGDDTPQRDDTPRPRRLLPGELLRWLIGQSDTDNMLCDFHVRDGMIKFALHCADGRS